MTNLLFLQLILSASFASTVSLAPMTHLREKLTLNKMRLKENSQCERLLEVIQNIQHRELSIEEMRSLVPTLLTLTDESLEPHSQMMEFSRIAPGTFVWRGQQIKLSHPIMMMTTLVTEQMWGDLMLEPGWTHIYTKKNAPVAVNRNHPVQVKWKRAAEFANRLSEKMGLKPAYDMQKVNEGFFFDAQIYEAEGYRLPTAAEMLWAIYDGGRHTDEFFKTGFYKDRIWEDEKLHDVATIKPIVSNSQFFHDLVGNGRQWANDYYRYDEYRIEGLNPVGPIRKSYGYESHKVLTIRYKEMVFEEGDYIGLDFMNRFEMTEYSHGFRLVRTVKKTNF